MSFKQFTSPDTHRRLPQGRGPQSGNHATFFAFSSIHTINEKLGFSRKNAEIGRKRCFSWNHACFWMISRNHAHFVTFTRITHVFRFTQSHRNKMVFTISRCPFSTASEYYSIAASILQICMISIFHSSVFRACNMNYLHHWFSLSSLW